MCQFFHLQLHRDLIVSQIALHCVAEVLFCDIIVSTSNVMLLCIASVSSISNKKNKQTVRPKNLI